MTPTASVGNQWSPRSLNSNGRATRSECDGNSRRVASSHSRLSHSKTQSSPKTSKPQRQCSSAESLQKKSNN